MKTTINFDMNKPEAGISSTCPRHFRFDLKAKPKRLEGREEGGVGMRKEESERLRERERKEGEGARARGRKSY